MSALDPAMGVLVSSEFCRVSMGIPAAIGVSVGLAGGTINSRGSIEQRKRWARDLMTFAKVGAWAITEPDAGSDAFGGMRTIGAARRRRVGAQRAEDVHHQRPLRRHARRLRQARRRQRPGPARPAGAHVRPRLRDDRPHPEPAAAQDGHALLADRPAVLRRGAPRRRPAARLRHRRRRQGERAGQLRRRAGRHRQPRARRHRGVPAALHRLREVARALGPADRGVPADPAEARADGGRPRQRPQHGVQLHRAAPGRPAALAVRGVGDQALLLDRGHRRRDGGGAALRRQRLHGGVPGRAARPRRQVADDLRRAPTRSRSPTSPRVCCADLRADLSVGR